MKFELQYGNMKTGKEELALEQHMEGKSMELRRTYRSMVRIGNKILMNKALWLCSSVIVATQIKRASYSIDTDKKVWVDNVTTKERCVRKV